MEPALPYLPLDLVAEIASRSSPATVVRCAATSKLLRRYITDPSFLRRLQRRPGRHGFDPSLLAGHFESHSHGYSQSQLRPSFVRTPLTGGPATPPLGLPSVAVSSEGLVESRGGLVVVRPGPRCPAAELYVCDPVTGSYRVLPPTQITAHCYIPLPAGDDDARSFRVVAVKLALQSNLVRTQVFTSSYAALSTAAGDGGRWGEAVATAVAGSKANVARYSPVVLRRTAHWLCKAYRRYHVLALHLDTMEATRSIALPAEVSWTGDISRSKMLLAAPTSPEGELGLLTLHSDALTVWELAGDVWTRRTEVGTDWITRSVGARPGRKPLVMDLECCGERSGAVFVVIHGGWRVVLSLQTMQAQIQVMKSPVICLYELDVLPCIATMKHF